MDFAEFPRIARLSREIVISEKLDGTNAQIGITEEGLIYFGSRTRWLTPGDDNYGFARWGTEHREELLQLGPGRHFGEWWGQGVQRKYGMTEKRFSLFNTSRWDNAERPACCSVVPTLHRGEFSDRAVASALEDLRENGSKAAPGFMKPEGVVVFHTAGGMYFKKTLEKDSEPKSRQTSERIN